MPTFRKCNKSTFLQQAGLLRLEHGEYWIEPSNQISDSNTEGRPHVIFKRSAVDKVKAYHRSKRAVKSNINSDSKLVHEKVDKRFSRRNQNVKPERESNEDRDRRRREYLEQRRKRLEAMRSNPVEYRRQQPELRIEERRMNLYSTSNSIEGSKSLEQHPLEVKRKNRNKSSYGKRLRRIKNRRRRKRRSKNCATKQPPYQWKEKYLEHSDVEEMKNSRNNKVCIYIGHH